MDEHEINRSPIYRQIANLLRDEIKSGKYMPEERFYSESILCKRFNTTHVTIRKSLRLLQQEGLISRRHGKGTFVNDYQPLKGTIGLLVWKGTLNHPAFSQIVSGISEGLGNSGYRCNLIFITLDILARKETAQLIINNHIDGLIMPLQQIEAADILEPAKTMPIVLIEQTMPEITPYSICCNTREAYARTTSYLISSGHRRIALIYAGSCREKIEAILDGYHSALESANIESRSDYIHKVDAHSKEEGWRVSACLLDSADRPTAIIAGDDYLALGAMLAIRERGLCVPADMAIVGYNDMDFAALLTPALTSVRVPFHAMGRCAAEQIIALINEKQIKDYPVELDAELIVRDST